MKYLGILSISVLLFACSKPSENITPAAPTPVPAPAPAPTAATLTLPANNTVCYEGTNASSSMSDVSFSWSPAKDSDSYDLVITNLNNSTNTTKSINSDTKTIVSLLKATPYSWLVISKSNKSKETATSESRKFYLAGDGASTFSPFPASIIAPASGANVTSNAGKVNLIWSGADPDSKVLSFEIYLDTDPEKVLNRQVSPIKTSNSNLSVEVKSGTVYYWSVKTSDGVLSSYSIPYSFKVN
jgi:hypothetical protein